MAWKRSRYERSTGRVTWRIEWRDEDGTKRSRALGPVTEAEADAELARIQAGERPTTVRLAPDVALERFLAYLVLQRRSPRTVAYYREHLGRLFAGMPAMPLTSWRRAHFEAFLASKPEWSPRTIGIVVNAGRRFLRWADEAGVEAVDFIGRFRPPPTRKAHQDAMSPDQVRSLVDATRGTPLAAPVALAAYGGLSRGDIRTLTWAEVDLGSGWIRRPRDKTGVTLAIPIVDPLSAVLRALPHREGPVCLGLPKSDSSLHKALHKACDRAGVPRGGWHRLRHFVATAAAAAGWDVATVGRLLGHRPGSAVTLGYLHSDEGRLREAAQAVADRISKDSASTFGKQSAQQGRGDKL